jgi:hypothetical protein
VIDVGFDACQTRDAGRHDRSGATRSDLRDFHLVVCVACPRPSTIRTGACRGASRSVARAKGWLLEQRRVEPPARVRAGQLTERQTHTAIYDDAVDFIRHVLVGVVMDLVAASWGSWVDLPEPFPRLTA